MAFALKRCDVDTKAVAAQADLASRVQSRLVKAFDQVPKINSPVMKKFGNKSIVSGKPDGKTDWDF